MHGRRVGYADIPGDRRTPEIEWLRANPHRLHLGRIGFRLTLENGRPATPVGPHRTSSRSSTSGTGPSQPVPARRRSRCGGDGLPPAPRPGGRAGASHLSSGGGRIAVRLRFPYGTGGATAADWTQPDAHETVLVRSSPGGRRPRAAARRRPLPRPSRLGPGRPARRRRRGMTSSSSRPDADEPLRRWWASRPPQLAEPLPDFEDTRRAAQEHWNRFWTTGGAIDLSGSRDPRWRELERRIVLSQYLTAIQCAGRYPPQETGPDLQQLGRQVPPGDALVARRALRPLGPADLLERSLGYYRRILPRAQATAESPGLHRRALAQDDQPERRGVAVVRRAVPDLAAAAPDLLRRARLPRSAATGPRWSGSATSSSRRRSSWRPIATWDEAAQRYVLGPTAAGRTGDLPEGHAPSTRPSSSTYWRWGLETAQALARAAGLCRAMRSGTGFSSDSRRPPVADGKYLFAETAPESYHRSTLGARPPLGDRGARRVARDRASTATTMRRTLDWIWDELELAGHLGLGLPDAGDVRGAPGRAGAGGRRAAPRHRRRTTTGRTATTTSGPA